MDSNSPRVCLTCFAGMLTLLQLRCEYETPIGPVRDDAASRLIWSLATKYSHLVSGIRTTYALMQSDDEFIATYFSTVHKWLPIIDRDSLKDCAGVQAPDPNHLLLLMSMRLILQRPDSQPEHGMMDNERYRATKQFYLNMFMDIGCTPSTKLLQSGVLLATYEYGHGMVGAACHTLSLCISASMAMSLHRSRAPSSLPPDLSIEWCQQDEICRVWWAIVISDRLFSLSYPPGTRLPLTTVANEEDFLKDLGAPDESNILQEKGVCFSGNFYRQVQAAILTGRVLYSLHDTEVFSDSSQARFKFLDYQIRKAIQFALEKETAQIDSISEALALNRR
ncbi:hypothetical protein UA08_06951 [Talaromyces atroroseus]|uniref:Xylanolytic transcriptional activator regulatory domain-containing protein n=1 Tax=Talaromyces atroroseus TaxID=1441469 RepID=A0A225APR8_TALAT|nr:hypothetical protein UA08_06951 [Talaromyces atroroseus]OKL57599.1 hypothetical protein UA08_06951 [Talaromyces atroroseus]